MKKKITRSLSTIKKVLEITPEISNAFKVLEAAIDAQLEEEGNTPTQAMVAPIEIKGNPSALALFGDGGCRGNPGPGAWGLIIQDCDDSILYEDSDFADHTTNNQMELTAVIKGLELIISEYPLKSEVHVYTDSKYVVDGMNSWVSGWKARGWKKADNKAPENINLWQSLDQLRQQIKKVNFHWVKGHAGHPQNERCDQLANQKMDAFLAN